MSIFEIHTKESAPAKSTATLEAIENTLGFLPNLYGVFAESPSALKAYTTISKIFDESSFSPTERQLILLTTSRFNECDYCMAAHTAVSRMQSVPADVVGAVRDDRSLDSDKLESLRTFAMTVVEKRGWVSEEDVSAFLAAGYSKAQLLEVILGISFKTLSNYTNHIAQTPLDPAFGDDSWSPGESRFSN